MDLNDLNWTLRQLQATRTQMHQNIKTVADVRKTQALTTAIRLFKTLRDEVAAPLN